MACVERLHIDRADKASYPKGKSTEHGHICHNNQSKVQNVVR